MSMKIDLSTFPDRFADNSKELSISKKVNFVFGKNGTGKSTIAEAIKAQFAQSHNVHIFDGYEGVVGENHRLDAIALGTENAEIQKQIDAVEKQIAEIRKETEQPQGKTENLFTKSEKAKQAFDTQNKMIEKFYTDSARAITQSRSLGRTYNTNNFQQDIQQNPKSLSDDEFKRHNETIRAEQKSEIGTITFPTIDLSVFLKSTNVVLAAKVAQQQDLSDLLSDLQNNTDKQNFAREGLKIHKHEKGEKCAFCGNEINEERWALLGSYFNDEVKKLEGRIEAEIGKITSEIGKLDGIKDISKSDFYDMFTEQIKLLNSQIKNVKGEYKKFLDLLKSTLEAKKKNLFASSDELSLAIPQDFSSIQTDCDNIVNKNNAFSKNLKSEQEKAKTALHLHEVKKALDTFKYDVEQSKLTSLETAKNQAKQDLDNKNRELESKKTEKIRLIAQTKDESKLASDINKLLKNMGVASFSLELVKDNDEQQKGQYQIKGHNGKIRPINELSKGEKNIIAFLYFILSLSQPSENNKSKIVVLDDPMTSNDDTMQYLMIGEIQKHIKGIDNRSEHFLLFTHNCHFYLNVRSTPYNAYNKHGNFHLWTDGKLTIIKPISNVDDDFKTNYEMLWKELLFLYEHDKPDLMLNCCRKICETYSKFNCIDNFYENNVNAKKLFDVNQHSIDDLEAEQNGKTKDEIKTILQELFKTNSAEKHFSTYWTLSLNPQENENNA